jgi:hypothetical protein
MARAKTVLELRSEVKAKDKFAAAAKPDADGAAFIAQEYATTADCALAFVKWLKGSPTGGEGAASSSSKPAGSVLESWHRQEERLLSDEDSAKARQKKGRKR